MTIYFMFGVYVALEKNPKGGGWIAKGKTRQEAITNLMKLYV